MMKRPRIRAQIVSLALLLSMICFSAEPILAKAKLQIQQRSFHYPVLVDREINPVLRVQIDVPKAGKVLTLQDMELDLTGSSRIGDVRELRVYYTGSDTVPLNWESENYEQLFATRPDTDGRVNMETDIPLAAGTHYFWVTVALEKEAPLTHLLQLACPRVTIQNQIYQPNQVQGDFRHRLGVAVRTHQQDGVHTSRIPGIATTNKGTLIAIFDARYESARDLQGHMDIGLHRSTDGGRTWQPLQIAMDMGEWGGLAQKFNGVSDACILVDGQSGDIYIAGTWMHGVLDDKGQWIEGLSDTSKAWNHQWRAKGSQPGYDVRTSSQFLVVKSTDDGMTWGDPVNITQMGKRPEWWLWAPAPGNGITLTDGTLVMPTQGRDELGRPFSNISYSKDSGKTWYSSEPAIFVEEGTTECAVVQLEDGSLMLNMRANRNRGNLGGDNGRAISVTSDLGQHWTEHPTSFKALQEPTCMASLYKHHYRQGDTEKTVLLFTNPDSKSARHNMTVKASVDDGTTWPSEYRILLDEGKSRGYSCITSVDDDHIGILYESSQADMVFQKIAIKDIIQLNTQQ